MCSIPFSEHFSCFSSRWVPEVTDSSHLLKSFSNAFSFGWGVFFVCFSSSVYRIGCKGSFVRAIFTQKLHTTILGTSSVVQRIRIHLPVQGTRVRSLVEEDSTCCRAAKPVYHSCWAHALAPTSCNSWARVQKLLKPVCLESVLHNQRSHCKGKPEHHNSRVAPACHN